MHYTLTISASGSELTKVLAALEGLSLGGNVQSSDNSPALPNAYAKSGKLVSLNQRQFREFYEAIDPTYQTGVKLLAKTGRVSCDELIRAGIANPGHFKSRTSVRAKTVLGRADRVQFATYSSTTKNGRRSWFLEVPPETLKAMQGYFASNPKA